MKKTVITIFAILTAAVLLFAGCSRDNGTLMDDDRTTTVPATTVRVTEKETTSMMNDNAGAPESTSQDSALGDAVGDAAEGAGDIIGDAGDAAERAGDRINDAVR